MQTTSPLRRLARNEYTWVGIAFVIAIVVAYLILRSTTTGTFDNLEQQNIQSQANRISTSLNYERSAMSNFVLTNAAWDDRTTRSNRARTTRCRTCSRHRRRATHSTSAP